MPGGFENWRYRLLGCGRLVRCSLLEGSVASGSCLAVLGDVGVDGVDIQPYFCVRFRVVIGQEKNGEPDLARGSNLEVEFVDEALFHASRKISNRGSIVDAENQMGVCATLAGNSPETKKGMYASGAASDTGRTNEKARVANGVTDFGPMVTTRPLNVAVNAFLSSLTASMNPTSLLYVGARPNAKSEAGAFIMILPPISQN
jgi:hypothetical protein